MIHGFPRALRRTLLAFAAALAACGSAAVFAQLADWTTSKGVRLDPMLEKVLESKGPDGAVRYDFAPGVVGASGDVFVLTLRFTNTTGTLIDGVRITSAIPNGLRYLPGSATGPGGLVMFSIDGGHTFGAEQEFAHDAGAAERVYTHVRWVLEAPLEVGATGFVRLRAIAR